MECAVNLLTEKVNTMNRPIQQKASSAILPTNVLVYDTTAEVAEAVAGHIVLQIEAKPASVLGLATGETPKPLYAALVAAHRAGKTSFAEATTFNLDEYVGLSPGHPDSFAAYMRRELFDRSDFRAERIHLLNGEAVDVLREAASYEAAIGAKGGIDLQLLGIGSNGHIGFNEPGSGINSRTRLVQLSPETCKANLTSMVACEAVPTSAITMGISTILEARQIIVMATGARKADAVRRAFEAPNSNCPASFLASHPDVRWLIDRDAASLLI
jgi:glucosamine-6-phosphate deaminase